MKFQKLAEEFVEKTSDVSPKAFLQYLLTQKESYIIVTLATGEVVKACIVSKRKGWFQRETAIELTCSKCQPVSYSETDLQAIRKNAT